VVTEFNVTQPEAELSQLGLCLALKDQPCVCPCVTVIRVRIMTVTCW
jgi:hypothetical protein